MKKLILAVIVLCSAAALGDDPDRLIFRRGDVNSDGVVNFGDIAALSEWLIEAEDTIRCMNAADVQNDGYAGDYSDLLVLTTFVMQGDPIPPSPGPWALYCSLNDYAHGCEEVYCPPDE